MLSIVTVKSGIWPPARVVRVDAEVSLDNARTYCADSERLVSIQSAEHVLWLKELVVSTLGQGSLSHRKGIPLGYDYTLANSYFDLNDNERSVQPIFDKLRIDYGWKGDYQTDQTSGKQHYAGFGWNYNGIEDWSPTGHTTGAVICETPGSEFFTLTGDCDIEGDCVSSNNYPGVYGNGESCLITMSKNASISVQSTFILEKCCDNLMIRKVNVKSASGMPKYLNSGETLMWNTDSSVTHEGWQFCFFATIYFTKTGDCDVVGDCVSSSNHPTSHGHNEQCTVTMIQDASVTVGSGFSLETCCDHLIIRGNYVKSPDAVPLTFNSGESFSWSSDHSVNKPGWQLCFSPYVAPVPLP